jgi:pimeloyl-ACP methyl ester carboxylesterase
MPFFQSGEDLLYYEEKGDGPPLFFVPPPALGTEPFRQQKETLSRKFRVVSFDPAGTGRSPSNARKEHSVQEWSADILALADHLALDKILLCGYSLGGSASQEFAAAFPERIKGLILLCTFPEVNTAFLSAKIQLGEWAAGHDFRSLLARVLSVSHTSRQDNRSGLKERILRSNTSLVRSMYYHGRHYKATERLTEITCPVTYIYGEWDPIARPYVNMYRRFLSHAEIVKISGAFHQLPTRNTEEVNAIIAGKYAEQKGEDK